MPTRTPTLFQAPKERRCHAKMSLYGLDQIPGQIFVSLSGYPLIEQRKQLSMTYYPILPRNRSQGRYIKTLIAATKTINTAAASSYSIVCSGTPLRSFAMVWWAELHQSRPRILSIVIHLNTKRFNRRNRRKTQVVHSLVCKMRRPLTARLSLVSP